MVTWSVASLVTVVGGVGVGFLGLRGSEDGILRWVAMAVGGGGVTMALAGVLIVLSALTGRRLLPVRIVVVRSWSCIMFRWVRQIGRVMGTSADELRRSFLMLQNSLVRAWWEGKMPSRVLVLLPHCLEESVRTRIDSLLEDYPCVSRMVRGGTEALQAVVSIAPDGLVAVACERDLLHGLMHVSGRVPWVLVLPNIQDELPCRSTRLDLAQLTEAMDMLAGRPDGRAVHGRLLRD